MEKIKFSRNYNFKLSCQCFTTIRKPSDKYKIGGVYLIELAGLAIKEAVLVDIETGNAEGLTEMICRVDTGKSKTETLTLLANIYGGVPSVVSILTFETKKNYGIPFKQALLDNIEKFAETLTQKK